MSLFHLEKHSEVVSSPSAHKCCYYSSEVLPAHMISLMGLSVVKFFLEDGWKFLVFLTNWIFGFGDSISDFTVYGLISFPIFLTSLEDTHMLKPEHYCSPIFGPVP